ncbi:MAG TPA: FecR domain-containing protein [Anaeromyxobacteraceae bacterium]
MGRSYADTVTDVLRRDAPLPPRFPSDRQKLVDAVERGLRARRRHQQIVRWSMSAGAAAAVLVLVIGGKTLLSPYAPSSPFAGGGVGASAHGLRVLSSPERRGAAGMMVGAGAAPVPLAEGMALPQGFRLVAPPAGEVRIGAARGTTLTLEGGGELAINEASTTQRYELKVGAMRARVAKLVPGERFIVATSDAEVEVHGTAFRVAVVPADPSCGGGTITRVSVTEGVVSVRRDGVEVRVTPGHVWPERCDESAAAAVARAGSPRAHVRGVAARTVTRGSGVSGASAAPAVDDDAPSMEPEMPIAAAPEAPVVPLTRSELAAQNDLFALAVRAKRRGHGSHAVRIFERFTREYPNAPLAESAAVERIKVLAVIDAVAARRAATEYLTNYPAGFARTEARHLLDTP